MTESQLKALNKKEFGYYVPISATDETKLRIEYNLSSTMNIYSADYWADGYQVNIKNREDILAKYKWIEPLKVPVKEGDYAKKSKLDEKQVIAVIAAPVVLPALLLTCFEGGGNGFIDLCPLR